MFGEKMVHSFVTASAQMAREGYGEYAIIGETIMLLWLLGYFDFDF